MAIEKDLSEFIDHEDSGARYLEFIRQLRNLFSEGKVYHGIKVTKPDGFTKVTLKYEQTSVSFMYRNLDLYIVGMCVESVKSLYLASNEYTFYTQKSNADKMVALSVACDAKSNSKNPVKMVRLAIDFDYRSILDNSESINRSLLGAKLQSLDNFRVNGRGLGNLGPIVVAFSEAIRFDIIANMISKDGIKKMINPVDLLGRCPAFTFEWLITSWAKMSTVVRDVYILKKPWPVFRENEDTLELNDDRLRGLLALAAYSKVHGTRSRRDITHQPSLKHLNQAASNATLPGPSSNPVSTSIFNLDVLGALHLVTLGMLHLTGRKWTSPDVPSGMDPREAQAIAVDLVEKVDCLAESDDFEETMRMQRTLSNALINGEDVVRVMVEMVAERFQKQGRSVEDAKKLVSYELAKRGGLKLLEGEGVGVKNCFKNV